MKLSIIVPAHNEQATIIQVLEKVAVALIGQWEKEIIVVDDGSDDGTSLLVENFIKTKIDGYKTLFLTIKHPKNLGKGAAIKSALEKATGDYIIIQDADLEYDPADFPSLLSAIFNSTPIVYGARGNKRYPERGLNYVIGAKLLTWAVNLLFGTRLTDLYTGYKLIPSSLFKSLNIESAGFEFEAEVTCKILKTGHKIIEQPINYQPRSKKQGKHIRFKDFLKGLWTIVKFRVK